jgi:hypothetical protein
MKRSRLRGIIISVGAISGSSKTKVLVCSGTEEGGINNRGVKEGIQPKISREVSVKR